MEYIGLYIGTSAMLLFSGILVYSIVKVTNIKKFMMERDEHYMSRLTKIEGIITKDLKDILKLLKNNT